MAVGVNAPPPTQSNPDTYTPGYTPPQWRQQHCPWYDCSHIHRTVFPWLSCHTESPVWLMIFPLHVALSVSSPALSPVLFMSGTRLSILFSIGLIFCDISVFSTLLSMMFSPHHKPVILVLNTFLSVCSSSLLITCPYQFNLLRYLIGSLRHSMSLGCVRAWS